MILIGIIYYAITVPYLIIHFRKNYITPSLIFLLMQLLMLTGILMSNTYPVYYLQKLSLMYLIAAIFFIFGNKLIDYIMGAAKENKQSTLEKNNINLYFSEKNPSKYQYFIIYSLILLSILVCMWFYANAGINIFLESAKNFIDGGNEVFSSQRKEFGDIPGVGYIYQFRTIILPVLNVFLILGVKNKKIKRVGILIAPLTVVFLLGTGQRNAFVFVMLFSLVYIMILNKAFGIKISKTKGTLVFFLATTFLAILTISNGRVASDSGNIYTGAIFSLVDRITGVNSRSALNAFIYIDSQPTVWGYDWLMMLADILPGKSGYMSVASITYHSLYGTYRGTEPPDIWGSAFYNWSWFGIILFPFFLGLLYQYIHKIFARKLKTKIDVLIYAALCTFLGIWISDSPMVLFNNGVVTIFLMYIMLKFKISFLTNNKPNRRVQKLLN